MEKVSIADSDFCLEIAMQWQKDTGASADATVIAAAILFGIGACVGLNIRDALKQIARDMPDDLTVRLENM